jgi:putative ABC transport system ATP-binding protein
MSSIVALDLCKRFGRATDAVVALDHVSLTVDPGEWVAVMGPSGCGKTSLLHILGGLDTPDAGTVAIAGEVVTGRSEAYRARLRRTHIGYVFQQYNLVSELDVIGNVELPLRLAGISRRAARLRARDLLDRLGVADRWRAAPTALSGGQQQRVAIARALIAKPTVVLADEPTGALDSRAAALVVGALAQAHQAGQTIVMVTHDASVAASADRIVHMRDGRIEAGVLAGWSAPEGKTA